MTRFECELGQFVGKEDAVTFASGCQTSMAVIPAICNLLQMDAEDSFLQPTTCFLDQYAHGSLYDGVKAAGVASKVFPHNRVSALAAALSRCSTPRKVIVVDGLYSGEADLPPLPAILALAERHDAIVYMDDAHGIGAIGPRCGGVADHFDVTDHPNLIIAGTLSKVFGGIGGFVAGSKEFCRLMRVAARASIFSHSLPPHIICGFLKGLEILHAEGRQRRARLEENVKHVRTGLARLGLMLLGSDGIPIVPVLVGDERLSLQIGDELLERGILAPPFRYPAVPRGRARIRVTVTAEHTEDQIDHLANAFMAVIADHPELLSIPLVEHRALDRGR